jgi:hypothetical protein
MGSSSNGDYAISNNVFISVDGGKAAVYLKGNFKSLEFYNNSFFNISSKNYGGVYLFIFFFLLCNLFFSIILFSVFWLIIVSKIHLFLYPNVALFTVLV